MGNLLCPMNPTLIKDLNLSQDKAHDLKWQGYLLQNQIAELVSSVIALTSKHIALSHVGRWK